MLSDWGLRWLRHIFRIPADRSPKQLLFGEVKELCPPGCSRSSFKDVVLCRLHTCYINRTYEDTQNRLLLWRDKNCLTYTKLILNPNKIQAFIYCVTLNAASASVWVPIFPCVHDFVTLLFCVLLLVFCLCRRLLWVLFIGLCCSHAAAATPGWSNSLIIHIPWT